ncbi:hypothetical protein MNBD_GAMMA11-3489, partial [hydrothermal vent metagenome]
ATSNRFIELTGRRRVSDVIQNPAPLSRAVMFIQDAGMALRANNNQAVSALNASFIKPVSLLSNTIRMNNTSHNQGDHCIIALPLPSASPAPAIPTIADANQVALQGACTRYTQLDAFTTATIDASSTQAILSLLR